MSSLFCWPCTGWLGRRKGPRSGGAPLQRYCVFCGPLLLEYETKERFENGLAPLAEGEVIGVAPWHASGRKKTDCEFIIVTRLGAQSHWVAISDGDRSRWMCHIMRCLNASFLHEDASRPSSPSVLPSIGRLEREVVPPPPPRESDVCAQSGQVFGLTSSRYNCTSCGDAFSFEYCAREAPLAHHGSEQAVRLCDPCYLAQQVMTHMNFLLNTYATAASDYRRRRLGILDEDKEKFEEGGGNGNGIGADANSKSNSSLGNALFLRSSLKAGFSLLRQGAITRQEFSELVKAEQNYMIDEAANRVRIERTAIVRRLNDDTLGLIKLLHDSSQSDRFNLAEFMSIIRDLHELGKSDLDSIDFYWPQLVHTHNLMLPATSLDAMLKVELLEDFMLAMCIKSPHLAVRLIWWLKGSLEDIAGSGVDTGDASGKQVNIIRLSIEVENVVLLTSPAWTASGDVRPGSVMRCLLKPTGIQSSLLADQMLMLRDARESIARERRLLLSAKIRYLPGSDSVPRSSLDDMRTVSPSYYFQAQLPFVEALVGIAEELRHIETEDEREEHLKEAILKLEGQGDSSKRMPGFLPVCGASDPIYPIVRIPSDEGHVFRTKARAPTLITCEIITDDEVPDHATPHHEARTEDEAADPKAEAYTEGGEKDFPRPPRFATQSAKDEISFLIDEQVGTLDVSVREDVITVANCVDLPESIYPSVAVHQGFKFVNVEVSDLAHLVAKSAAKE